MENLACTKDILGEHLHQKVKEVCPCNNLDGVAKSDESSSLVSKITGILLERPVEDIFKMLRDKSILETNIKIATDSLTSQRVLRLGGDTGNGMGCSGQRDDNGIRLQVYQKVCRLDPSQAPQITSEFGKWAQYIKLNGVLLEMDKETIDEMLNDEDVFQQAFEKAKGFVRLYSVDTTCGSEDDNNLPLVIYQRAEYLYKHHAPKITGMILELDKARLIQIVEDKLTLDQAITKAYTVLSSKSYSSKDELS